MLKFTELKIGQFLDTRETQTHEWETVEITHLDPDPKANDNIKCVMTNGMTVGGTIEEVEGGEYFRKSDAS